MTDSAKHPAMMAAGMIGATYKLRPLPFNRQEKTPKELAADEARSVRALTAAQAKRERKRLKNVRSKT